MQTPAQSTWKSCVKCMVVAGLLFSCTTLCHSACILGAGYQSAFNHCDKIHEIIAFERGRVLGSGGPRL